ncbi:hypothetical protein MTO96_032537 [Rhipicephalus appendiculatus]
MPGGPRCQATDFDASPGPRLDERDADGLRPADWDLGCCERDEDLLSRRCAERDFGRRVCDRDLLLRRLAGRDPGRRNGDLLSRRCCWLLLFPSGGKDVEWSRGDGERLLEVPLWDGLRRMFRDHAPPVRCAESLALDVGRNH